MTKNKIYFFASLMTFCFAKSVSLDVKVNAGVASISNVKTNFKTKDLKTPEWQWKDPGSPGSEALLRDKIYANIDAGKDISKDGGASWTEIGAAGSPYTAAIAKEEYLDYVGSAAKNYALEKAEERHHYGYAGDETKRKLRGGFSLGLTAGVNYELTPCVKLGATAFFTATNLKRDLSYAITPVDKDGNIAYASIKGNREVQMLLGHGAIEDGNNNPTALADTVYYNDGLKILKSDLATVKKLSLDAETKETANNSSAVIVFALNINKDGYNVLKETKKDAGSGNYIVTLDTNNYGTDKGIVITKAGFGVSGARYSIDNLKTVTNALLGNTGTNPQYNIRNYKVEKGKLTTTPSAGHDITADDVYTMTVAVNGGSSPRMGATIANAGEINVDLAAGGPNAINTDAYVGVDANDTNGAIRQNAANTDKLVMSEDIYKKITGAFEEVAADLDVHYVDQTLKVQNVWGGMVTLSWNATDCTMFTLGLGVGIPSIKKIDSLKKKVGFAGMFEISTRVADSFYVGLRYQYNRLNLKEKNATAHTVSKLNGNFHMFSATATYSF